MWGPLNTSFTVNSIHASRPVKNVRKEQNEANWINLFTRNQFKKTTDKLVQMSYFHMNLIST